MKIPGFAFVKFPDKKLDIMLIINKPSENYFWVVFN